MDRLTQFQDNIGKRW